MDNKKKKALRRVLAIVLFFSFNFSMIGCKNIDNNREETIIRDVVKDIQLYQSSDSSFLFDNDIIKLDSIADGPYHKKVVQLKITIYSISKQYAKGSQYVMSLKESDFNKTYQRSFYLHMFDGLNCMESQEIKANAHFKKASESIQKYLDNNVDEMALFELANIHKIYLKEKDINWIINKYNKSQNYDQDFINGLLSFDENQEVIVNAKSENIQE